jgi:single-strand DNA-binding protein
MSINNTITIIGNLVADPELRFNDSGKATMNARVAVNERYYRNDNAGERTNYFNVVCWDSLAENTSYSVKKGDRIMVSGRLQIQQYKSSPESSTWFTEIVADEIGVSTRWAVAQPMKETATAVAGAVPDMDAVYGAEATF